MDYSQMVTGYDDVPEDHGFVNDPLPAGRQPFKVEKEVSRRITDGGTPEVTLLLRVIEGRLMKRTMLHTMYLCGSKFTGRGADGKELGKGADGKFLQRERSPEEFEKANRGAVGRVKAWLSSLRLPTKFPTSLPPTDPDYLYEHFGVTQWVGQEVMGEVIVEGERNRLRNFHSVDDPKWGVAAWRSKQQGARVGVAVGVGV